MRLAAFSDSHGDTYALRFALEEAIKRGMVDVFAFLGDGVQDFYDLQGLMKRHNPSAMCYAVRGNNDYARQGLPEESVVSFGPLWVYLAHGHRQRVKLTDAFIFADARERQCTIALFGHTHRAFLGEKDGVLCMNPGSVALPTGKGPSFGLLTSSSEGNVTTEIVFL